MSRGMPLRMEGIGKTFGRREVLRDIDLDASAGQFVAIVGKSGCGKTTLLRIVAGLETASAGRIVTDDLPARGIGRDVRMVFQDARLLPWRTVLANVMLGQKRTLRPAALRALEQVGLREREGDLPSVLSGGQRQRVALARALVSRPRLLLLDEPLGALDALTRLEMQHLIERLWLEDGFTALLVTHEVSEAVALADRVLVIEQGTVALDVAVDMPRPRDRGSRDFVRISTAVLNRVMNPPSLAVAPSESAPTAAAAIPREGGFPPHARDERALDPCEKALTGIRSYTR